MNATYLVRNETRETTVADRVRKTSHPFERLFGLCLRSGLAEGEGLWVAPCRMVHTFGMRFTFDAIYLDESLIVVGLTQGMRSFRIGPLVAGARSVLEVGVGTIASSGTDLGDKFSFAPVDYNGQKLENGPDFVKSL